MSKNQYSKRIEYRPPDPMCTPYIAYAAVVAAGLDGIKRKIDPGDPIDKNIYKLTKREKEKLGIRELPRDLWEALDELKSDHDYLKPIFPDEFIDRYIELKREEFKKLSIYPSPIEFLYYYHI
jgi:glutamine synthetase